MGGKGKPNHNDPRDTPRRGRCEHGCDDSEYCAELREKIKKYVNGGTDSKGKPFKGLDQRWQEQLKGRQGPINELLRSNGSCESMFGTGKDFTDGMAAYIDKYNVNPNSHNYWSAPIGNTRSGPATALGWCSHEERYLSDQKKLEQHLKDYDDNKCPDDKLPKKARELATRPAVTPQQWADNKRSRDIAIMDGFSDFIPAGRLAKGAGKLLYGAGKYLFGGSKGAGSLVTP